MSLYLFAPNIYVGGGAILLNHLISKLDVPVTLLLDSRFEPQLPISDQNTIHWIKPGIFPRIAAEIRLKKILKQSDTILCFSNLPPLFKTSARVFVYLQNAFLLEKRYGFLSKSAALKNLFKTFLLTLISRDVTLIVQSFHMKKLAESQFDLNVVLYPFVPDLDVDNCCELLQPKYDYIYPASSSLHKNHKLLIEAWIILASKGFRPSLCLTLNQDTSYDLLQWVNRMTLDHNLNIHNSHVPFDQMTGLYRSSCCLIYPSLLESFGLPLLEARRLGLSVIAAELDYVRDILDPDESFDPNSAVSISRAVERHAGIQSQHVEMHDVDNLLDIIM